MYVVRKANLADMDFIIGLAAREGWNPGLYDGECFFSADPNGFLIGELSGEPIGCISAVSYGAFGFIGLYIIKEGYRGKGYGITLWNQGMQRLQGCNIGLDGVVAQQENYKRSAFRLAHRNLRFEGILKTPAPNDPNIVSAEKVDFDEITSYDAKHFPAERRAFLSNWINMQDACTLVYRKNEKAAGLGTIRKCLREYKIGPLFADSDDIAESLFLSLCAFASTEPVFLDISEKNAAARALCDKYNMTAQFETARMYTGEIPAIDWDHVYGITTFELG